MAEEQILGAEESDEDPAIYDVSVDLSAVLGTSMMEISQVLKLGRGAVVELDRRIGEDIELNANNELIARGEIIVMEDKLGVTITDVVKRSAARKTR